jgi:hypothetical protein
MILVQIELSSRIIAATTSIHVPHSYKTDARPHVTSWSASGKMFCLSLNMKGTNITLDREHCLKMKAGERFGAPDLATPISIGSGQKLTSMQTDALELG